MVIGNALQMHFCNIPNVNKFLMWVHLILISWTCSIDIDSDYEACFLAFNYGTLRNFK